MSRVRFLSGLSAALAFGLAACGGDTTSTGDPLTEAEAAELAEAIAEGGFAGFGGFAAPAMRAPGETAANVTVALNDTYPCDDAGGTGTVTIAGSLTVNVNDQTGAGTFGFNYTVAPHGCQVTTSGGKVFTLDGDPNIKVTGDFSFSETTGGSSFEGTLNYDGSFAWESSDGRSGTCGVNLDATYDFNFSSTGGSGSATLTGTVCGVTVNRTFSVEA